MSFLLRFSFFALIFGFISGLLARRILGTQRVPEMLLVSLLPWGVYLFYNLRRAVLADGFGFGVVIAGLVSIAAAVSLVLLAPRFYRPRLVRVALFPLVLAALHGLILLAWSWRVPFALSTTLAAVGYVCATLFFSAALWAYALPSPRLPGVGDLGRRR